MSFKVLIIGSGLSGTLLANGLLKNNVSVTVYERDAANANREGYQIRLGAPALHGFRECLPLEVKDAICSKFGRSGGAIASAPVMYTKNMALLVDLTKFPAYPKSAPINRAVLRDALAEPVARQGCIVYGKAFVRYEVFTPGGEDENRQRVRAYFADGTTDEGDVLVAADGNNSRVNAQVGLNNIITLRKIQVFLAKGPISAEIFRSLPAEIKRAPVAVAHENKMLFTSCYLPDKVVSSSTPKDGEPEYDEDAASIMMGFNCPASCVPENIKDYTDAQIKAFILDLLKDWDPKILKIIDSIPGDNIYSFHPKTSSRPAKDWRTKASTPSDLNPGNPRIWLLGDAIHPMLPSRGMGGNQAMHDSGVACTNLVALAALATEVGVTNTQVATAVGSYEAEMIPRAFGWVAASGGGLDEDGMPKFDFNGVVGTVKLMLIKRALDVASLVGSVMKMMGWRQRDDAPEFK